MPKPEGISLFVEFEGEVDRLLPGDKHSKPPRFKVSQDSKYATVEKDGFVRHPEYAWMLCKVLYVKYDSEGNRIVRITQTTGD